MKASQMPLRKPGYKSYTKMHGATGEGEESEPKLDTHFWPGRNNTLLLGVPDDEIERLDRAGAKTENRATARRIEGVYISTGRMRLVVT